jgi:hypothetical protein
MEIACPNCAGLKTSFEDASLTSILNSIETTAREGCQGCVLLQDALNFANPSSEGACTEGNQTFVSLHRDWCCTSSVWLEILARKYSARLFLIIAPGMILQKTHTFNS